MTLVDFKIKMWPFLYLPPEKIMRDRDRERTKPSFLLPVNILSQQTPAMQTALGETGGSWNCLNSNTDTTGNKTTCTKRRATLLHSPQSKCLHAPETRQILLLLTRGCNCSVPTDFGYSFCKESWKRCKIFSKYAQLWGFKS